MKELINGEAIDDRRLKKRQRKQDKTRKMQSKLTYQPMVPAISQSFTSELPTVQAFSSPSQLSELQRIQKARLETQEIHNNSDPDSANQQELESLRSQLTECKSQLRNKTIELEKSTQLFTMFDQQVREMQVMIDSYESQKRLCTDTMIKYLTELEDKNRREKRMWLNEQSIKLGRLSSMR
jgi:hypothetical protein